MLEITLRMAHIRKILHVLLILQVFLSTMPVSAQEKNAVIPGDFADPSIIKVNGSYYATGTSSEWAPHFPVFKSADMIHWAQSGYVFNKTPEWTASSFWAPEYFFYNNTYFIYYAAKRKKDGISCIGVATSKFPDKDFEDHGVIIEFGKEAIDPFVFNDHGQLYITWKAYGLDGRPIEIVGSKLSEDGLTLVGKPFSLLRDDPHIGLEGQSILFKDNYYYLFYSAGNCCGVKCDYNVRVARSKSLQGPYELDAANPILKNNGAWKCPGHGTFVSGAADRYYYLYHGYNIQSNVFTGRQGLLAELVWPEKNGWPVFKEATTNIDYSATLKGKDIIDNFPGSTVSPIWQWDFRHVVPVAKPEKDGLHLTGNISQDNFSGAALTVRPYSASYDITTTVVNHNSALKGLVIYGDASAAAGIGTIDNKVELWMVKANKRTLLASEDVEDAAKPVDLKMSVNADFTCKVFWKQQGAWKEIVYDGSALKIDFLPQWDRSPRPGLNYHGDANKDAVFSNFTLKYTAK